MSERLYVVVRADLPIGLQMAQVIHAAVQFERVACDPPIRHENVVVLHVGNERDIDELCSYLSFLESEREAGLVWTCFLEPDLDNAPTAIAVDGVSDVKRWLRGYPLAFSASRGSSDARARSEDSGTAPGDARTST